MLPLSFTNAYYLTTPQLRPAFGVDSKKLKEIQQALQGKSESEIEAHLDGHPDFSRQADDGAGVTYEVDGQTVYLHRASERHGNTHIDDNKTDKKWFFW